MATSLLNRATGATGSIVSGTFTPGTNVLLVVCWASGSWDGTTPAPTVSDTFGGLTWTQQVAPQGGWSFLNLWTAVAPATSITGTITVTAAGSGSSVLDVIQVGNPAASSPVLQAASGTAYSFPPSLSFSSPPASSSSVLAFCASGNGTLTGAPSGFTELDGPSGVVDASYITSGSPTAVTWSSTQSSSSAYMAALEVALTPAIMTSYSVTPLASTVKAGSTTRFTVAALDQSESPYSGYNGTVQFTSSDSRAVLPASGTISNGTGTFTVELASLGSQTISVVDVGNSLLKGTSAAISVLAADHGVGVPTHLRPTAVYGPPEPPIDLAGRDSVLFTFGPQSLADAQNMYPGRTVISVAPGVSSVQNAIDSQSTGGIVYFLRAGIHSTSGTYSHVSPRQGDVIIGQCGSTGLLAALDGSQVWGEGYRGENGNYHYGRRAVTTAGTQSAFEAPGDVTIRWLEIRNFGTPDNEYTINHGYSEGWVLEFCDVHDNGAAGVCLSTNCIAQYSRLHHNGQYGFTSSQFANGTPHHAILDHCEVDYNNQDDIEHNADGSGTSAGASGAGKFWNASSVQCTYNYVHNNLGVALWADTNNNDFLFAHNYISDNYGQGIFYEISWNATIQHNTFIRNGLLQGFVDDTGSPAPAIYFSESGTNTNLPTPLTGASAGDVSYNSFVDNQAGMEHFEGQSRFSNSPSNTSGGYHTEGWSDVSSYEVCQPVLINGEPYYGLCRWKNQDWTNHHNDCYVLASHLHAIDPFTGAEVTAPPQDDTTIFATMSEYSNFGNDYPAWSPYPNDAIEFTIANSQNNQWHSNNYFGDWGFILFGQGNRVAFDEWQGTASDPTYGLPAYGRDTSSVLNPVWDGIWPVA